MTRRTFNGTTLGAPSTVTTGVDWSAIRGAFVVSGRLYTGHADGTMTVRDFDGTTAGFATESGVLGADTFTASGATDAATGRPSAA